MNLEDYNIKTVENEEQKEKKNNELQNVLNQCLEDEKTYIKKDGRIDAPENKFTMAWYYFWVYFRLPIGIVFSIGYVFRILSAPSIILYPISYILEIIRAGFIIFLFDMMYKKKKNTFSYIIVELCLEMLSMALQNISKDITVFAISLTILFAVWFVPNYIYFKKRKEIFVN